MTWFRFACTVARKPLFGPAGRLILSSVNFGMPRLNTDSTTSAAALAAGPKSHSSRTRAVDTAMLGIASSAPSSAPETVPEYVTSSPRFHPLLMPETIEIGLASKHVRDRDVDAVGRRAVHRVNAGGDLVDSKRTAKRQRVADRARLLNGGHDRDLTKGRHGRGQRPNPLRVHAIVIGYENPSHQNL